MIDVPCRTVGLRWIDRGLDNPVARIVAEETLWRSIESDSAKPGIFHIWEPTTYCVVLGRGSRRNQEVDLGACQDDGIPIVQRCSGGASIVTGPGCLMYAFVLPLLHPGSLPAIEGVHRQLLGRLRVALSDVSLQIQCAGTSDLAFVDSTGVLRKFSGNSLRIGRNAVLYHGTMLYAMQLDRLARWLRHPPREPVYRGSRGHLEFCTNLPLDRETLVMRLETAAHEE